MFISDPSGDRDTVVLSEVLDQRLTLPLPDDSYQLVRSSVENVTINHEEFEVLFYHRDFGENEIEFQSSSGRRLIYKIDFVNQWIKNGLNTRDRIFLLPENKASLDLTKNDLWKDIHSIEIDHPDLNISTSEEGVVQIEPVKGFTGKTSFSYITCSHPRCDTAIVDVYVDHFEPAKEVFDIDVNESDPSHIPFYTPVRDFEFSVIEQPKNGELTILEDGRGFLFTPSGDFSGEEKAIIRYSHPLPDGNEYESDHELNLMVGPGSTSCIDCVWPGDTDRSGVVDLGDLENIGRFIGEKGERRAEGDRWMGQNGNPWMSFEDSNLHHYDADGDGLISEQDILTVLKNYGKEHGLYTKPVVAENIPVEILTSSEGIEPGEEFVLEFLVGDEDHVLTDISGFSAELEVEGAEVSKKQVDVIKDRSTWLKSYQPTIVLKAPSGDNQVAVGEFRVRSIGADGHGTTLKLRIIVEDEIEGFRTNRAAGGKAIKIILKNMTLHAGEDKVRLPDRVLVLPVIEGKENPEMEDDEVLLYPVPAGDYLKVEWKSSQEVQSVRSEIEGFRTNRAAGGKAIKIILKNMTLHAGEDKVRLPDRVLVLPVIEGKENPEMEDDEVLLYPVPAGDYLKVEWKSSQEVQSVGLYNMTGKILHKYEINEGTNHLNIDVGSLPEGMYILQLNDREKTRVRKFPVVR